MRVLSLKVDEQHKLDPKHLPSSLETVANLMANPQGKFLKDDGTLGEGSEGPQGPQGDKGETGDKGPNGDKGITGEQGQVGNQGPTGDKGVTGDKGATGDQGDKGVTGDKGPTGDQGPAGNVADGYTYIIKSANQDVTNAGVTNDTEFYFSTVASGHYLISMDLVISGNNTTGDYTAGFYVDAGTITGKGTCQNLNSSAAVQNIIITAAAAQNTTAIVTGAPTASLDDLVAVKMQFACIVSNATTFRYRFGNASTSSGRTSRTWKGSIMRWKRLD